MKTNQIVIAVAALAILGTVPAVGAADGEGVALAIVYDTSGSMRDPVKDSTGKSTPKYVIANHALIAIAGQIEAFVTNGNRTVQAGLYTFHKDSATAAIPMGPFNRQTFQQWAEKFDSPTGNTPLGNSLDVAAKAVLNSPLPRKHVLVITDGLNTAGPTPASVMPKLRERAESLHTALSVHFVAFDVDAKVFSPLKKQGATVVAAANEEQLNSQLQYILQRKILLEDEEPKK